jgi:hypothetical protein
MSTTDKNFKVKNGLDVAGDATFGSDVILGTAPLRFDTTTNKLQIQLNGTWSPIAFVSDIPDPTTEIGFMDIGLAIDYNGLPVYTVQANGVNTTATKFADGGAPETSAYGLVFDSGVLV